MSVMDDIQYATQAINDLLVQVNDVIRGESYPCEICEGCEALQNRKKGVCKVFLLRKPLGYRDAVIQHEEYKALMDKRSRRLKIKNKIKK